MREVDVVVLGSGISGSIAARLLAMQGHRVAIISKDNGTQHHLPESWFFSIPENLRVLGLDQDVHSAVLPNCRTVFCSSDGAHAIEISIHRKISKPQTGDLLWIDRNRFDRLLLAKALDVGAVFYPNRRILDCRFASSRATILVEHQNCQEEISALFVIDATGKTAYLAHQLNLPTQEIKLDPRIACFSHFEMTSQVPQETRIVALENGYLFCIPVSDHRLSVGCVIAEDCIDLKDAQETIFSNSIARSSYVSHLLEKGRQVLPVISAKNHQCICLAPGGKQFRLVGDAAAFLDPFFCPGIDFAFYSAALAVETMHQDATHYTNALMHWLNFSKHSIYEYLEQSKWQAIMRLFADPHLPLVVPVMLTQAFGQVIEGKRSFLQGIQTARSAYEMASC